MKKKPFIFLGLLAAMLLSSCGGGGSPADTCVECINEVGKETVLPTPETDSLAFPYESDYASKDFAAAETGVNYGKATLYNVTDGDTAVFRTISDESIRVRFLAINTPESTGKVEPWGVKASHWFKKLAETATDWCLVNDIDTYGHYDNSGGRNLAFVWYKSAAGSWRLYNLECVEQCYSDRQLFVDSPKLGYLPYFQRADEKNKKCGYRVYGQKDPTYDYSDDVVEATIYEVLNNYSSLGITDESSGKQLHIKALVLGLIGDNLFLRDITRDLDQKEDEPLSCIYGYAGYGTSLASWVGVGDVVYFYCRATSYSDTYQLSDIKGDTRGKKKFEILVDASEGENYGEYLSDINPLDIDESKVSGNESLKAYAEQYVSIDLTVRNIIKGDRDDDGNLIGEGEETYYNQSSKSPYSETIYGYVKGTKTYCNIRIDGNSTPKLDHDSFAVGKSYRIKGRLTIYYEKYQLMMFNNIAAYNYFTELN
ncbi:MAG: thermonuclease family protein [Bacilli bacterium]|nr:thermonuclease family protein [Bacilli bacterium]